MTFLFNNRGVSHLSFEISDSDTEIRIPWEDFNSFMRSNAAAGDLMYAILRGPISREIVAIDLINSFSSTTDKYLKVARAQGGTSSTAWPAGTLLFISTHADHYGAIFQPDEARQIDFNPNGVLSPNYAAEKVFQFSGCEIRWWMSFDAVNPYWHLIAGDPCITETFFELSPGFNVWAVAQAVCWDSKFNDAFWTPEPGNGDATTWTGSLWTSISQVLLDPPLGGWEVGYLPYLMKVTRPILADTTVNLEDTGANELILFSGGQHPEQVGPSGFIYNLGEGGFPQTIPPTGQIKKFSASGQESGKVDISGIDFFICKMEDDDGQTTGFNDGYLRGEDLAGSFANARNQVTAGFINTTFSHVACYAAGNVIGNPLRYWVHRAFLMFDLSAITITDIREVSIQLQGAQDGPDTTDFKQMCVQEGTQGNPLTTADYHAYTGPVLNDLPQAYRTGGWYNLWFNQLGKDFIEANLGGTVKFCIRDYQYDYLNVVPAVWRSMAFNAYGTNPAVFRELYPLIKIYGD